MLATNAAPGIATRRNGRRGLTAQISNAAMAIASSGNCQTHALKLMYSFSPSQSAYTISARAGTQSQIVEFVSRCQNCGRNFYIAAITTPNTSGSSRVQVG